MASRARTASLLLALFLLPGLATTVSGASAVSLDNPIWIAEHDLGLEAVAAGGSADQMVLVAGAEGYARLLDGDDPSIQIELGTPTTRDLRAIDWHPRGNTALIAGDNGALLRYAGEDHSVTTVSGSGALTGIDLNAVAWNAAGSHAYLGGEDGWIWAYHEGQDGIGVFELLNDTKSSQINGIACHPEVNLCVVATDGDGIGVIDTRTEHTLYWIGGPDKRWMDVDCAEPNWNRCIAVGDGRAVGRIGMEEDNPARSAVLIQTINGLSGEFTHAHSRGPGESLVTMAPFHVMAWDSTEGEGYEWVDHQDVANISSSLAGERLIGSWGTVDDADVGFLVTSYGGIIGFHPEPEPNVWTDSLISYVLGAVVLVAVPGVVLGLIFMNSETLQRKYHARRAAKREAKQAARVEAEKAAKRAARKKS